MEIELIVKGHYLGTKHKNDLMVALEDPSPVEDIMFSLYSKEFHPKIFSDRSEKWVVVPMEGVYNPRVKSINKYFHTKRAAIAWIHSERFEQETL